MAFANSKDHIPFVNDSVIDLNLIDFETLSISFSSGRKLLVRVDTKGKSDQDYIEYLKTSKIIDNKINDIFR